MKKVKLRFFGFLAILITLVSLFVYVRMNSKKEYNLSGETLNDYQAMSFSAPIFLRSQ